MSIIKHTVHKLFAVSLLIFAALILSLSADAAESGGKVTASCLHFRAEPSTSAETLSYAYNGDHVIILEYDGDWCKVVLNGVTGYMFAEYVEPVHTLEISPASAKVTSNSVRFLDGADANSKVVYYLNTGSPLKVHGIVGEWYDVTYGNTRGYMHSDYVEIYYDESDYYTPGQQIIEYAKQFLGTKYVYGGASPRGFDCSGFTSYVLQQNGYDSTRTCTSQYAQYTTIERSELRIGDLVFFASSESWDTNHVGLYMGNNLFIHAASGKGKVMISSLEDTYFDTYYYGAARYLPFH